MREFRIKLDKINVIEYFKQFDRSNDTILDENDHNSSFEILIQRDQSFDDDSLEMLQSDDSREDHSMNSTLENASRSKNGEKDSRQIDFEIVPGKRFNSQLLWSQNEMQFYKFNTKLRTGISYLCYHGCSARVIIRDDGKCYKTDSHKGHNHSTNYDLYKELATKNELKKKCIEDSTSKSVKEIYDEIILRYLDHFILLFSIITFIPFVENRISKLLMTP